MTLYRFHYSGAAITFACRPRDALRHAARFARYTGRELLRISELRQARVQLKLIGGTQ